MLKTPELAMNKKKSVKTKCHGKVIVWAFREDAKDYFLEAMMNSDELEYDRYSAIYIQLVNGLDTCSDE